MSHRLAPALVAAALLALSGVAQIVASTERWVIARGGDTRVDGRFEDHRFDYLFPYDPWEPIGSAAQLAGAGYVLAAFGALALALAVQPARVPGGIVVAVVGATVTAPLVLMGVHGIASGMLGAPSPLAGLVGVPVLFFGALILAGLLLLAIVCARRTPLWTLAAVAIGGLTPIGYLIAAFTIAPALVGEASYDTTPWTETVVGAFALLAALLVAAGVVVHARPRRVMEPALG